MPFQTGVIDAIRDWGLTVHQVAGWQTRGSADFHPQGHVVHHDVIGPNTSVPGLIIDGRSDLSGPLANFWLERDGDVHLVAAGRANHAGEGSWRGLSGNSSVWGTEMNNLGTPADPWPAAQLDAMQRLAAATAEFSGFPIANVCGHKEWTTRKIDPHSINMTIFRAQTSAQDKSPFDWSAITHLLEDPDMIIRFKAGTGTPPLLLAGRVAVTVDPRSVEDFSRAGVKVVDLDGPGAAKTYETIAKARGA